MSRSHPFPTGAAAVVRCVSVGLVLLGLGLAPARVAARKAEEIKESKSTFESGGKTITVERFEPKGDGKYPAVLVVHGADGFALTGNHYKELSRAVARKGYVALLVHYFERTDTKAGDGKTIKQHFKTWAETVADALAFAEKQPNVDAKRIGLVGVSLGAYLSVSLAAFDPRIKAVVEYFGGIPKEVADGLKKTPPILILHGDADKLVPVEEAHKLERVLKDKNQPYEIKIYAGQGHGFTGEAGTDALRRTIGFLDKHLKKQP
jgi:carboxymethylenebutenolidase